MLKKINSDNPLPKYYQICDSIKEKIIHGEFPSGSKIPTCRELMKYFNTTVVTVSSAVRQLEEEGYINKVQGKGMFVTNPEDTGNTISSSVAEWNIGLAMQTRGDLHQSLVETLVHDLEKHGIHITPYSPVLPDPEIILADKEDSIRKYIKNGLDALVMNGKRHMPYKLLYKYREKFQQMNFLMHYESGIDFPDANIITFDYYKAGYLAGEHLLKAGHKKFAFISYYELPEAICRRNGCRSSAECHDMIMLSGMKAALDEAGIPASNITVIREPESIEEQEEIDFKELLKRGPLGIFAMGDSRVIGIYKTAVKIGIDIARDFNIVGLYNTSWAEVFHPTLSSISIKETEIAHLTADCIINRKTGCRIVIEPELIVRET